MLTKSIDMVFTACLQLLYIKYKIIYTLPAEKQRNYGIKPYTYN